MDPQRTFHIAIEAGRRTDIMLLPCPHLQDEIVGVGARNEVSSEFIEHLFKGCTRWVCRSPQLFAPPLLREQPGCPYCREGFDSFLWLFSIVPIPECRVRGQRRDLSFQPYHPVRIGLGCSRSRHDSVSKGWIAYRPLKSLLRAHGETDHGFEMRDLQV